MKKEEVLVWLRGRAEREAASETEVPKTPLMRLLAQISGEDVARIRGSTAFIRELNFDSLLRVELAAQIDERYGATIDEAKITTDTTVVELDAIILASAQAEKQERFKTWPLSPLASAVRVFAQSALIFPFWRIFMKLRVEGAEHLEGLPLPAVFMPNHVSYLDHLALAMALPPRIRRKLAFAAARDFLYENYRSIVWLFELLFNSFPFPRKEGERIKSGLDHLGRMLDRGCSVVVYPEGKMSESGELLPLKRGAGLIAAEMHTSVVPVKLTGTAAVLPYAKIVPRKRAVVTVKFGQPLTFGRGESHVAATERIARAIRGL